MKKSIHPITRIEGHGHVELVFDEGGTLQGVQLLIGSFRGIEELLVGRPVEEVPRIVTRICGLCPWAHLLASLKAIEDALGVTVPAPVNSLRRLAHHLAHIQDKILHFFMLSLPDFLGMEKEGPVRGLSDVMRMEPGLAKRALDAKRLCYESLEVLGGKAIHPVAMVIGGHLNPPDRNAIGSLERAVKRLLDFSVETIEMARRRFFLPLRERLLSMPFQSTGFLGTVGVDDQCLELYEGPLRSLSPMGQPTGFSPQEYQVHLVEKCVPWSYSKVVMSTDWQDPKGGPGTYRVNSLARLIVSSGPKTPRARAEYEIFQQTLGDQVVHPMNYHWARLIEMVYCCEAALDILRTEDLLSGPYMVEGPVIKEDVNEAKSGIGCVEAPRGTLIHHYEISGDGLIKRANLIVGTTHNIAPMNQDIQALARQYTGGDMGLDALKQGISMVIRAHDP